MKPDVRKSILTLAFIFVLGCSATKDIIKSEVMANINYPVIRQVFVVNFTSREQRCDVSVAKKGEKQSSKTFNFSPIKGQVVSMLKPGEEFEDVSIKIINPDGKSYIKYLDGNESYLGIKNRKHFAIFGIGSTYEFIVKGEKLEFIDAHPASRAIEICMKNEILRGDYDFKDFSCESGDVMIDIGAHIGMASIYYAKQYPQLKIYAFEPIPENSETIFKNLKLNNVKNVSVIEKAVTHDGQMVQMEMPDASTMGGVKVDLASPSDNQKIKRTAFSVESTTLEDIFKKYNIEKCKILKIDCEGSEYEILLNTPKEIFQKIEYLAGEFHINKYLESKGYSIKGLVEHCKKMNPAMKIHITPVRADL